MHCDLEKQEAGVKYTPVTIDDNHPAMAFLQPSPLTVRLGFPLVLRRGPTHDEWRAKAEATGNVNSGLSLLLFCVDPKSKHWGKMTENLTQGTVVAMRHDKQDLHLRHLEALFMYLTHVFGPAMNETLGPEPKREKEDVVEMLYPSRLHWFFKLYRKEKVKEDKSWGNTPPLFNTGPSVEKEREGD
ncbi:MAG: hypothetical protein Q9213_006507 [Squamulea squamosa]